MGLIASGLSTPLPSIAERDLVKWFSGLAIDWSVVEKQLVEWSALVLRGKKLRLDITFNYVEKAHQLLGQPAGIRGKRGRSSATQRMRAEMAAQIDAEEKSTGLPSIWKEVYRVMRCTGAPCQLGPHCWRDPSSKRHYKLNSHHLRSLVKYVDDGHQLQSQDDVPNDVREQFYAEEQRHQNRKLKASTAASVGITPITINNHFPEPAQSTKPANSRDESSLPDEEPSTASTMIHLDIPGPRDVAVKKYAEWQQTHIQDLSLKIEVRKACGVVLSEGLDLEQLHQDQDAEFSIKQGMKRGVARRFVNDIDTWVKRLKRA